MTAPVFALLRSRGSTDASAKDYGASPLLKPRALEKAVKFDYPPSTPARWRSRQKLPREKQKSAPGQLSKSQNDPEPAGSALRKSDNRWSGPRRRALASAATMPKASRLSFGRIRR